jgi:adenosine deaminase
VVLGAVESLDARPIRALAEAGVPVTLSTDIGREYGRATELGFARDDLPAFIRQAIRASFTTDERRTALLRALDAAG